MTMLHKLAKLRLCPRVIHIGLRFLGVPGTNVKSESNWSKADITTNGRRNRLSPEHCDQQLFLNQNYDLIVFMNGLVKDMPDLLQEKSDFLEALMRKQELAKQAREFNDE